MIRKVLFSLMTLTVVTIFSSISLITPLQAQDSSNNEHVEPQAIELRALSYQKPNMQGDDVLDLQLGLADLGLYQGKIDGYFGPKTLSAVKKLQSKHNLEPTGLVTYETWELLKANFQLTATEKENLEAPTGVVSVIIDTRKRTLTIFSDDEPFKQYPCAVGKASTPTPVGNWKIKYQAKNWGTGFGSRWNGLNTEWGIYGIHGTNKPGSIGSYASHGCIRMWNKNVEEIYPWLSVGTPVYIIGNPFGINNQKDTLVNNSRGSDVMMVQRRLIQWGYLDGKMDGVMGSSSEKALIEFQKDFGLEPDGQVNIEDYEALKLK